MSGAVRVMAVVQAFFAAWFLTASTFAHASVSCQSAQAVTGVQRSITGAGPGIDGTQEVALPDKLAQTLRREHVRISYTLDVSACANHTASALWLFRVNSPYRISAEQQDLALLNSRALLRPAAIENVLPLEVKGAHNGRIPALFALPPGAKTVTIELLTLPSLSSGIVRAQFGPTNLMLPVQAEAAEVAVTYVETAATVLLVLSVMLFLLWLARRSELSLLWLAVACGLWSMRGLAYFGHKVYLDPMVYEQFNSLNILLSCAALATSILFMLGNLGKKGRRTLGVVVTFCVSIFIIASLAERGALLVRAFCLLGSLAMVCWLLTSVLFRRDTHTRFYSIILTCCLSILLGTAVHDLMLLLGRLPPDAPSYVFWGFVILLLGFTAMSGHYVVLTLNRAERSNEDLELRVADKTVALQRSYEKLRESEQEAAKTQERTRLMRDMHDGLGAQLMTALRGVELGTLSTPQIALSLQDSLDELRLLIDSADMGQHLYQALGGWRSRWETRLAAAGVMIEWHIDDALDDVVLPKDTVLQAVRILQEAAANVVKHSRATRLILRTRLFAPHADGLSRQIQITVTDNGTGLADVAARSGSRGLQNMKFRSASIGAQLEVTTLALPSTGCQVLLTIPMADELPAAIRPG